MIILGIREVKTDHKDSLMLTKTRLAKELGVSVGTFQKYFIDTKNPEKPKAVWRKGRARYSEKDVNNFLYNHVVPLYGHMRLLKPLPTKPVYDAQNKYYQLQNKYNLQPRDI